ncbi:MAG: SusD/RagB family nutrient-binding outer membrane lipoprotein [Bacteroidales bacterium]
MKKSFTYYFLFLIICSFQACVDFEKLNIDPSNPPYIPGETDPSVDGKGLALNYKISAKELEELKASQTSIGKIFARFTYEGCFNDYQITTNLTHDIYAGYMANNTPSFHESSPTYVYNDEWSKRRWEHFYDDRTATEYAQLIKTFHFVDSVRYKNVFHLTRIYYAFLLSMQTDTYGDIPLDYYLKGLLPPHQQVTYTSQSEVYAYIFQMLDEAVKNIDPSNSNQSIFASTDDKCFQGDVSKWLRFANTLRLRLALRISNVDPQWARREGEAALNNRYGLMRGQEDNMRTVPKYAPLDQGGENASASENIFALVSYDWKSSLLSYDLAQAYYNQSSVEDPRASVLWWRPTPVTLLDRGIENTDKRFTGMRIGDPDITNSTAGERYSIVRTLKTIDPKQLDSRHWFSYSREIVWLGYAESRFLLAEAALRGWNGTEKSAESYFIDGITASMQYYQIPAHEIAAYIDNLNYKKVNLFQTQDKEALLEQIITQKWLAVFPNGNEGWAEFRRTDYPALENIVENNSDGDVMDGKFIKRISYPYTENKNPNKPKGILQGTRLWWDIADTNNDRGERLQPNNFGTFLMKR